MLASPLDPISGIPRPALRWGAFARDAGAVPQAPAPPPLPGVPAEPDAALIPFLSAELEEGRRLLGACPSA